MLPLFILIVAIGIILEAVSLRRDPSKVELENHISSGVTEPGAPFELQATITNKSRVPISYLMIREVYPPAAEIPDGMMFQEKNDGLHVENVCRIKSRQRKKLIFETSIKKRGVHMFKGSSMEFGDFLGFNEISKNVSIQKEIVVYPERIEYPSLNDALANYCGDIAAKRYLIRDPILTIGCREYTGREPMKDIHWLQSARRGELMVREFEYNRQLSVNVILSVEGISSSDDEGLDACCAAARTICERLLDKGVPVSFFTNALLRNKGRQEIWKCDISLGHTGELLEGLGRVSYLACTSLDRLLEYAHRENDSDAAFIVILLAGGEYEEKAINRLKSNTNQEVLVVNISQFADAKAQGCREETVARD